MAIDSAYMYVGGVTFRPEHLTPNADRKRNLSDGELVAGFGTSGVVTENPSSADGEWVAGIAIDSQYMYVAGTDRFPGYNNGEWRIEKRNLSDGVLGSGFGTGGVVTENPSTGWDDPSAIAIDSTYMYVAGTDNSPGNNEWRIEKRAK